MMMKRSLSIVFLPLVALIAVACSSQLENNTALEGEEPGQCHIDRYMLSDVNGRIVQGEFIYNEDYLLNDKYELGQEGAECVSTYIQDEDLVTLHDLYEYYPVDGGTYKFAFFPSGVAMPVLQIDNEIFGILIEEDLMTYDYRVIQGDTVVWDTVEVYKVAGI